MDLKKNYQKILPVLLNYHTTSWLFSQKTELYIPHNLDFRGRLYSNSLISPIYNKTLRPLLKVYNFDPNWWIGVKSSNYFKYLSRVFKISCKEGYLRVLIRLEVGKL